MPSTARPLLAHQHRALAAAAGLVGRPRLAAGLALTLACACGPLTDDSSDTGVDPSSSAATTIAGSSGATTSGGLGSASTSSDDAGHSSAATSDATLLTDASTTLATTGDAPTSTTTDTGDATSTGTTGELDDCFLNTRTMEVDWDCCEQQNWLPSPQCTPWGPPAPPVAGARMQAARQARQVLA